MKLLTVKEAADRLGGHYQTLRVWADAGMVRVVRLGSGHRRFDPRTIDRFRREMEAPEAQTPAGVRLSELVTAGLGDWAPPGDGYATDVELVLTGQATGSRDPWGSWKSDPDLRSSRRYFSDD
jgi:excisionase family DNA binding protein